MFLFIQIILGLLFSAYTIILIPSYSKNVTEGTVLSLVLLFAYYTLLYQASAMYKKEKKGLAYFLVIGGFLILTFAQFFTCLNSVNIH